jgi:hypothetical protein
MSKASGPSSSGHQNRSRVASLQRGPNEDASKRKADPLCRITLSEANRESFMQGSFSRNKLTVDELMPSVYEELRRLADRDLVGKKAKHTLGPTYG